MTYMTNKGYRSGVSYSFSSRPSDYMSSNNIHIEYTKNFDVSYSGKGYDTPFNDFSYVNRGSNRIGYDTKGGNSFLERAGGGGGKRIMGGRGGSRGVGRGKREGIGRIKGQGNRIANKGQRCIDMQNQFIVEGKNNDPLIEIDLAIKNLNLPDLPQNQIITPEFTQLEMVYHKEAIFVKKSNIKARTFRSNNKKSRIA